MVGWFNDPCLASLDCLNCLNVHIFRAEEVGVHGLLLESADHWRPVFAARPHVARCGTPTISRSFSREKILGFHGFSAFVCMFTVG